MGKSYAASTVERYESLRRRGVNCMTGPGMCARRARWAHVTGTTKDGLRPGQDLISEIRLCDHHKRESDRTLSYYGRAYGNAELLEVRPLAGEGRRICQPL